jgi:hypothetical protein
MDHLSAGISSAWRSELPPFKPIGVRDVTENHWVTERLEGHWTTGALYDYKPSVDESERLRINPFSVPS